jgi:hypothetical protein
VGCLFGCLVVCLYCVLCIAFVCIVYCVLCLYEPKNVLRDKLKESFCVYLFFVCVLFVFVCVLFVFCLCHSYIALTFSMLLDSIKCGSCEAIKCGSCEAIK